MKYILLVLISMCTFSVKSDERVFYLEDLSKKINSGMSATQYCEEKAKISEDQAKRSNAPKEVQVQIKKWVSIACTLDIIDEPKRMKGAKVGV